MIVIVIDGIPNHQVALHHLQSNPSRLELADLFAAGADVSAGLRLI